MDASLGGVNQKTSTKPSLSSLQQQRAAEASMLNPVTMPVLKEAADAKDKMAVFDAMADMELAAEQEDWDDFADADTAQAPGDVVAAPAAPAEPTSTDGLADMAGGMLSMLGSVAETADAGNPFASPVISPRNSEALPQDLAKHAAEPGGGAEEDWGDFGDAAAQAAPTPVADDFGDFSVAPVAAPTEDADDFGGFEAATAPAVGEVDGSFGDFSAPEPANADGDGEESWQVVSKPTSPDSFGAESGSQALDVPPIEAPAAATEDWGDFGDAATAVGSTAPAATVAVAAPDQPIDEADGFGDFGSAEPVPAPAASGPADPFDVLSDPSKPLPDANSKKKNKVNHDLEGDVSPRVLYDILVTAELLEEASECNRHVSLADTLQDFEDQKARAVAEDRFEEAAKLRDRIGETETQLGSLPSLESLKKQVRETRRLGTTFERIVASLEELDSSVAAAFRDRYCAGGTQWATMGLAEHARADWGGALQRQRAGVRSANLYHTLKTSQRGNVWTETVRAIAAEVRALESLLGEVAQQSSSVQKEVLDSDKLASYVAGVLEMVQVGHLIRASAADAIWRLPVDDALMSAIEDLRSRLLALQLAQFVAALDPRPCREPEAGAEICALSLQPIQGEPSVSYGTAVCLAPCGNFFVNRVLGGTITSLSGYVDVF